MARKPGSTILQEELHSPSAGAREEMDDARLLDLDVDEESPFLRGQKRVSARRNSLPQKTANRLLWSMVAVALLCVAGFAAAALYRYGEHSWRFRVESSDDIEVMGMQNVTKAQIMEVMGADIGRNIFFIPLTQQKTQLDQIPWVESASVMRFVPNRLKVEIHERTPVAFARVGPRMYLLDAGGTLMELTQKHRYSFPVILGMNPGEPLSTRRPRMKAYGEMVRDLDTGGAHYSQDLSEVDLSDLEDVKVRVNDPAGDVLVHLGSSDYLGRYKIYITHAQGWRQQFQKLESVDLRYDNQIIVNPDLEKAAKQVPLNPSMARTAAPAGVKPASLLTRVGPNDRPVPKPAFELTQKKLDPKTTVSGTNKAAWKTKTSKAATRPTDSGAVAKKAAAPSKTTWKSAKKPAPHSAAARRVILEKEKKSASRSEAPRAKAPGRNGGGQKPSPAIAKTQNSQEPSD